MKQQNNLLSNARALRKNMTKEERRLWYEFLRNHPVHIYRQRIIGTYIADFYCAAAKIVIELDGSQHYEDTQQQKDAERTRYFEELGLRVIRIPNNAVRENFEGVCAYIDSLIRPLSQPLADSSP